MTIAVADWLLNGVPLQVTLPHWGKAYPNRGYGGMFRRIKGAQAIAAAIYLARQHQSKEEIRTYIEETFGYDLHRTCDDIRPRVSNTDFFTCTQVTKSPGTFRNGDVGD